MADLSVTINLPLEAIETMPTDRCVFFYECKGCGILLKPKAGDYCDAEIR